MLVVNIYIIALPIVVACAFLFILVLVVVCLFVFCYKTHIFTSIKKLTHATQDTAHITTHASVTTVCLRLLSCLRLPLSALALMSHAVFTA
jgi:hypothetical protein